MHSTYGPVVGSSHFTYIWIRSQNVSSGPQIWDMKIYLFKKKFKIQSSIVIIVEGQSQDSISIQLNTYALSISSITKPSIMINLRLARSPILL
jgi:hypothetical protein